MLLEREEILNGGYEAGSLARELQCRQSSGVFAFT